MHPTGEDATAKVREPASEQAVPAKERTLVWMLPVLAVTIVRSGPIDRLDLRWQFGLALALGLTAGVLWQILRPRDFVDRLLPLAWIMVLAFSAAVVLGPYEERFGAEGVCSVSVLAGLVICEDLQRRRARRR